MSKVTIIDPHFDGGDLARKWTPVISNTPWSKTIGALQANCPSLALPIGAYDSNSTAPLIELAHLLRRAAAPALAAAKQIQGKAVQSNYDTPSKAWSTTVETGGQQIVVSSSHLILAQGSEPRTLDIPIPSIPLEMALDEARLAHYTKAGEKAIVFGTMHSGTLVIRNLAALGVNVTAYYNTAAPFYWARDNVYDGIKAEAAEVADKIVAGEIPVDLVPVKDTAKVIRGARAADWVVYAMGFMPRNIRMTVNGAEISPTEYDGATGMLTNAPAWGFGVAYPNRAPDGVHWDVSVAAFLNHAAQQLPRIIQ